MPTRRAGFIRHIVSMSTVGLLLCGCEGTALPLVSDAHWPEVPHALRLVDQVNTPETAIERALTACPKFTEVGETECVKAAIAGLSITAIVAMVPGCRLGLRCQLTYDVTERIGIIPMTATHYKVRWRVDLDMTTAAASASAVPVSVVQVSTGSTAKSVQP